MGKGKEAVGDMTDDERFEAEGKGDRAKANLKQAAENVKDAFGLPRGFRTAELMDSSTLPGLAVDNHSGLRWAAGNRARSAGVGCCKTPRYSE